jgi:hypothetical protein
VGLGEITLHLMVDDHGDFHEPLHTDRRLKKRGRHASGLIDIDIAEGDHAAEQSRFREIALLREKIKFRLDHRYIEITVTVRSRRPDYAQFRAPSRNGRSRVLSIEDRLHQFWDWRILYAWAPEVRLANAHSALVARCPVSCPKTSPKVKISIGLA